MPKAREDECLLGGHNATLPDASPCTGTARLIAETATLVSRRDLLDQLVAAVIQETWSVHQAGSDYSVCRFAGVHDTCGLLGSGMSLLERMYCVPPPVRMWPSAEVACETIEPSTTCCRLKPRMAK